MTIQFSGKYSVSPDVISATILEETMLLNVKTLVYICLDTVSAAFWRLLQDHHDLETVCREFESQQPMAPERLEKFLNNCITGLQRAKMITLE